MPNTGTEQLSYTARVADNAGCVKDSCKSRHFNVDKKSTDTMLPHINVANQCRVGAQGLGATQWESPLCVVQILKITHYHNIFDGEGTLFIRSLKHGFLFSIEQLPHTIVWSVFQFCASESFNALGAPLLYFRKPVLLFAM